MTRLSGFLHPLERRRPRQFDALEQYRTSPLFNDAERAALDYVTELTKDKKVNPNTFARMARYYSERQICEIVWLVASEHPYNMTNIGLNIHSAGCVTLPGKGISARGPARYFLPLACLSGSPVGNVRE